MIHTPDVTTAGSEVVDTPGKRGRKAKLPNPNDGPIAAFAHDLWGLKRRAGDPSFATMCTRLGAAASKSALAAATRGTALPSWETTWEFVRVLAVDQLGADAQETHRTWLARWTTAGAASTAGSTAAPPAPAQPAPQEPAVAETTPEGRAVSESGPASPVENPAQRKPVRRLGRSRTVLAWAVAVVVVGFGVVGFGLVGLGILAAASPPSGFGHTTATQFDDASFEGDVTFPDGSVVATGQRFTKVWQLRNTGSVRWEERYLTRVNSTSCQVPDMVPIPVTDPGRSVRIAVPVTASETAARCKIYWKMTDATRRLLLPDKNPIFLDVVVRDRR